MKTIVVLALLAISLVAVIAEIGFTRTNGSVPSVEATHQSAVVILGCGPAKGKPTYLVEAYSGSAEAPALGGVISLEDPCAQALKILTNQDFNLVGVGTGAFSDGDGFLYTLMIGDVTHVKDDDE